MLYNNFSDKSVLELREMFPNANFLDNQFDRAVMGMDNNLNCVIYHEYDMIHILMKEINEDCENWDTDSDMWYDLYDQCQEFVNMIESENECFHIGASSPKVCRDSDQLCNYSFNRPESF